MLGLGLLISLFWNIDFAALGAALRSLPWQIPAAVALCTVFSNVFKGFRFRALYSAGLSRLEHAGLVFGLNAGNILLPLRAGEFLRPYFLKARDPKITLKALAGWTLLDKAVEAFGFGLFVLVTIALVNGDPRFASFQGYAWPTVSLLALALAGVIVFLRRSRRRPPVSAASLASSLLWGLASWGSLLLIFWVVAPDPSLALPLLVAVTLGAALPGLPAGLGPFEAAFVAVAAWGGATKEEALARALVAHLFQALPTLVVGGIYLLRTGFGRTPGDPSRGPAQDPLS